MKKLPLSALACACVLFAAGPAWAGGDAAAGKALSADCADCHGEDGKGDEDNPSIAGMAEADFIKAVKEYADGTRSDKMMTKAAKKLSDKDVADLAAYFATL